MPRLQKTIHRFNVIYGILLRARKKDAETYVDTQENLNS